MAKAKIVEAAGVAGADDRSLGDAMEKAMAAAVAEAYAVGINHPDKVRAAILEARAKVKAKFAKAK